MLKNMKKQTNIMFIRDIKNITKPYITLEFIEKRVMQCRAKRNIKPNDDVVNFVNDWCKNFGLKSCFS